jgi:hypothetical protein
MNSILIYHSEVYIQIHNFMRMDRRTAYVYGKYHYGYRRRSSGLLRSVLFSLYVSIS